MSANPGITPHNFTLPAVSGPWIYSPGRDTDLGWTAAYTGTPDIINAANKEGMGYMYFRTQTANGTKVALNFTGVQLHFCIRANGAKYQLAINGTAFELSNSRLNDPQCSALGAPTTVSSDVLVQGAHQAELTVLEASPSAEMQLFGAVVISEFDVGDTPAQTVIDYNVDDVYLDWSSIQQAWDTKWLLAEREPLAWQQTRTVNCEYANDQANSINFTGASAAVLWGFLDENTHYYSVQLNDVVFHGDASTSMWRAGSAPVFVQAGLDPGTNYTLTYRNFNENFPDCTSTGQWLGRNLTRKCCAGLDRLQLWGSPLTLVEGVIQSGSPVTRISTSQSSSPTAESTYKPSNRDSSDSPVAAIVLGVIGGVVIISVVVFLLCWRLYRSRQGLGRPIPLAGEDGDAVQPWLESLRKPITAFHAPAAINRSSSDGEKGWATKPLPALPQEASAPVLASTSGPAPGTHGGPSDLPLQPVDMHRVLAYVAARMDPPRPRSEPSSVPPSY